MSCVENPLHSKEEIERITVETMKEANTLGKKSRFGYFSIPYSAGIGDRHYALATKPHERDDNGRVKLQPRNIQTTIMKWGKSPDVYFNNILKSDAKLIKERAAFMNQQRKEYLDAVKAKKEEKSFRAVFKPCGNAEKKDYFALHPYNNEKPIYKEQPRKTYYDKELKKVIIENKNIMTNPPKKGTSSNPGILFSYPKRGKYPKKRPNTTVKIQKDDGDKEFSRPFKPANTMLNGFFYDHKKQYAPPETKMKEFKDLYERAKSAGGSKYVKPMKENYAKHLRSFFPASGKKSGEKGYFSQRYGVPFVPYIAKKRVQTAKDDKFSQSFK